MKLPLEELRDKYIPVETMVEEYGISILTIQRLIRERKIRYAEFKAPGSRLRVPHVNPEEVLSALKEESM